MEEQNTTSRRRFIRLVAVASASIPFVGCSKETPKPTETAPEKAATAQRPPDRAEAAPSAPEKPAAPANLPHLEESDPTATALGYRHDATQVDASKFPKRAGADGASQFCHNCSLFVDSEGQEWAGCSLFPGKAVHRDGWCNGWVPRAG